MQETELKMLILPTFSVSWFIILTLDVNILYYKTKICFIDLIRVWFPLQDPLKQAARCWNKQFHEFLEKFNFQQCNADQCVYLGQLEGEKVYLALYVDDRLILTSSRNILNKILEALNTVFEMTKENGNMFVGIEIERDRSNNIIFTHQKHYVKRVLVCFNMSDANPVSIPVDPHTKWQSADVENTICQNTPYREAVALLFLASVSRPDISYAVGIVSRYLNNYDASHWNAVKRILKYLKETVDLGITYKGNKSDLILTRYRDSDYATDIDTRRSTNGYIFKIANGPVTWSSKR